MALHVRGAHSSRRGFGANRRGMLRGGSSHRGSRGALMGHGSSSAFKLKRGMAMRESGRRGRGVRLRGGSRMQRRGEESEDSEDEDEDDEEEEIDSEDGGKERHRRRRRRRTDDQDDDGDDDEEEEDDDDSEGQEFDPEEEMDMVEDDEEEMDEEEDGLWDSDREPPVLLMSDLNDDLLRGSYLTVTLQRPDKAKKQSGKQIPAVNINMKHISDETTADKTFKNSCTINKTNFPGSIVPKLEAAMGPRMTAGGSGPQLGFIQRKTALSKHMQARFSDGPGDGVTPRGPGRYFTLHVEQMKGSKV